MEQENNYYSILFLINQIKSSFHVPTITGYKNLKISLQKMTLQFLKQFYVQLTTITEIGGPKIKKLNSKQFTLI